MSVPRRRRPPPPVRALARLVAGMVVWLVAGHVVSRGDLERAAGGGAEGDLRFEPGETLHALCTGEEGEEAGWSYGVLHGSVVGWFPTVAVDPTPLLLYWV